MIYHSNVRSNAKRTSFVVKKFWFCVYTAKTLHIDSNNNIFLPLTNVYTVQNMCCIMLHNILYTPHQHIHNYNTQSAIFVNLLE